MIPGTLESAVELSSLQETLSMHSVAGWGGVGGGTVRGSGAWLYWEHSPMFTITGANRLINI